MFQACRDTTTAATATTATLAIAVMVAFHAAAGEFTSQQSQPRVYRIHRFKVYL